MEEEARERLIIQKLQERDPSVLADMCRDYSEKLKWFVFITYPYIRNFPWFEASDIVAETFLKAFKAGGKYDLHKGMLYPWLKGIANNVVKSYLRRCAPSMPIEDIAGPDLDPSPVGP